MSEQPVLRHPGQPEGDPGKLAYLHDPNWSGKLFSANLGNPETLRRKNFCGACHRLANAGSDSERAYFSDSRRHEDDERCMLWRVRNGGDAEEIAALEQTLDDMTPEAA